MTYNLTTETTYNFTKGPQELLIYVAGQVPGFVPALLFAFFMIVFLSGLFLQRRQEGTTDTPMWFSIAGYLTFGLALLMTVADGLISMQVVVFTLAIAFIGGAWYLTSRDRN